MTYATLTNQLLSQHFRRVERDDRLLDVFPSETREKGVELWEKWDETKVEIVRLRVYPFHEKATQRFILDRKALEAALLVNTTGHSLNAF